MSITRKIAVAALAALGFTLNTAQAGVGISIAFPGPHYHHRPCYGPHYGFRYFAPPPPRPVYVYPQPTYVYPAPVYVQPAPVAYIAPPPPLPVAPVVPAATVPVPAY
jgi:hypothetical protein